MNVGESHVQVISVAINPLQKPGAGQIAEATVDAWAFTIAVHRHSYIYTFPLPDVTRELIVIIKMVNDSEQKRWSRS